MRAWFAYWYGDDTSKRESKKVGINMTTYQGKSWQAATFGAPQEVLHLENITWQPPTAGRLLIKVHACGVGLPDMLITTGNYPLITKAPAIPGQEVAGEVVSVPEGSAFSIGDRVMGITLFLEGWGGYSDYAYVRETHTRLIPHTLTDEEAAGFLIGFKTAHNALIDRISVTPGETVLVLGASGSSGIAAIQLAKALGATVIAVTSSADKATFCTSIGADHVVNRMTSNVVDEIHRLTNGRGADIIFDTIGGELGTLTAKAIAQRGRFALIGYAGGSWAQLDPLDMVLRNYSAVGVFGGGFTPEEENAALNRLCKLAASGAIKTPVSSVYAFDEVPAVIQRLADGNATAGKSIVRISG
jgi:NADPH2:quinone reductase